MKGIKIEIENEQPMYLYRPNDVIGAIAHALYYSANPDSEMCIPNCAFEKAEKMFAEWRDEVRVKNAVELLTNGKIVANIGLIDDSPMKIDKEHFFCKSCLIHFKKRFK